MGLPPFVTPWRKPLQELPQQDLYLPEAPQQTQAPQGRGGFSEDQMSEYIRRQMMAPTQPLPPEIGQYQEKLTHFPKYGDPQYKPSRLRNILGDVAGAGIGALTVDPVGGEQTAHTIHDMPYRRAVGQFGMETAPYAERAEAAFKGLKAQHEMASTEEQRMRGLQHLYETTPQYMLRRWGAQPQTIQERQEDIRLAHPQRPRGALAFPHQGRAYDLETGQTIQVAPPIPEKPERGFEYGPQGVYFDPTTKKSYQVAPSTASLRSQYAQQALKGWTPAEQQTAMTEAIRQLGADPKTRKFLNPDALSKGRYILQPQDTPEYKAFESAVTDKQLEILQKKQPNTGEWEEQNREAIQADDAVTGEVQ